MGNSFVFASLPWHGPKSYLYPVEGDLRAQVAAVEKRAAGALWVVTGDHYGGTKGGSATESDPFSPPRVLPSAQSVKF